MDGGGQGGGARARGGGARASVAGGVGGRGTGPRDGANFATCVVICLLFLTRTKRRKKEDTHRSWPGGRGGRPRALIPGGRGSGKGWLQKGGGVREAGQGLGGGGGARASVPGGVGGRGTGPRDGANFATCRNFCCF